MQRTLLFIGTNLLVLITISLMINILGLTSYFKAYHLSYEKLAIFCLLWGSGGAFISLMLSKFIAKLSLGVVIINPRNATREEHYILDMIYSLAKKAQLPAMPEVGIYSSPEINAFATGPSKSNSLVAVSSGLLNSLNREEIEAVLGHEISHIANGDMVTMTLLQGVINAFALFLSRIIAQAISLTLSREHERESDLSYVVASVLTFVFDILFTLLGSILVAAFSRWREYRADYGSAKLVGKDKMIAALKRIRNAAELEDDRAPSLAVFKISHHASWLDVFSTHPPIEKRINRLQHLR